MSPSILLALNRRERRSGLSPRPNGRGCLMRTESIHTIGMREWLWAVVLDGGGKVMGSKLVRPRRVYRWRTTGWILELPASYSPPPPGMQLVLGPESVPKPLAGFRIGGDNEQNLIPGLSHEGV